MKYTVLKNKFNRIGYRIIGLLFLVVSFLQLFFLSNFSKPIFTAIFAVTILYFGVFLIYRSFKKTSYSITYFFHENGIDISYKKKTIYHPFSNVEFITMVIPDSSMLYYILNLKIKKELFIIPFYMKKELCEKIYDFVNDKINKEKEV